jgi:hypothetical protein
MPLKNANDAHDVAGVLKLFLRSLPEPLLSYRMYDSLLAVAAVPTRSRRVLALSSLLSHLDPPSRATLNAVLAFLQRVAIALAAATGGHGTGDDAMNAHVVAVKQLARAFSPVLLRLRGGVFGGGGGGGDENAAKDDAKRGDHVIELLIEHRNDILGGNKGAGSRANEPGKSGKGLTTRVNSGGNINDDARNDRNEGRAAASANAPRALDLNAAGKENAPSATIGAKATATAKKPVVLAATAPEARPRVVDVVLPSAAAAAGRAKDPAAVADAWMSTCVGSLFGGDDVFTAEIDRAAGTGLEILYKTPVLGLAPDALATEKKQIKRRLRSFDNHVLACSGRKATKEDKRHLRPLYLRLAHVKRQMHVLESVGAGVMGGGAAGECADRQRLRASSTAS